MMHLVSPTVVIIVHVACYSEDTATDSLQFTLCTSNIKVQLVRQLSYDSLNTYALQYALRIAGLGRTFEDLGSALDEYAVIPRVGIARDLVREVETIWPLTTRWMLSLDFSTSRLESCILGVLALNGPTTYQYRAACSSE